MKLNSGYKAVEMTAPKKPMIRPMPITRGLIFNQEISKRANAMMKIE
ncbi:hypothetical protein RF371_00270 [Companilactobacillus paralimentarius]|nr:hypothetical protein [Companilactobacillus paralimentarius]MDR4932287.1 hypothetical protein [Companilactobacillus paralimentarius]